MMRIRTGLALVALVALTAALFGCSGSKTTNMAGDMTDLEKKLEKQSKQIASLENDLRSTKSELSDTEKELKNKEQALRDAAKGSGTTVATGSKAAGDDLFPNAKVGECYAKVWVPATYNTRNEQVLAREAGEHVEVIPAKYEWVTEKVLVKEASERLEIVPAKYDWVTEKVLVKEASKKLVPVAAEYKWETERVLVKPAHTVWKKGRGPIEKVDNSTGEIVCLVEVPATYKDVKKRVQVKPETTKEIEIPAEYKTVKKRVVVEEAQTRTVEIPAEYETVKIRKMVTPPSTKTTPIEAQYETVTVREKVSEGKMEWRQILCETNMGSGVVLKLQRALDSKGFNPGPIDGIYGTKTQAAVIAYQKKNNLASGELTMATLKSLGIQP